MNIKKLPKEIKKRYKNDAEGLPKIAYDLMEEMRLQSLKLAEEEYRKQERLILCHYIEQKIKNLCITCGT